MGGGEGRRDLRSRPRTKEPHASSLRTSRVSVARQTYSITKRCGTPERQIIADPLVPLNSADNADAIISSLFWLQILDRITYYGYVIMRITFTS